MSESSRAPVLAEYLPISVLMVVASRMGDTPDTWFWAYSLASIVVLIQLAAFRYKGWALDPYAAGLNFLILTGTVGFVFGIEPLLQFLGKYREAASFPFIMIIGLQHTFSRKDGFLGTNDLGSQNVRWRSLVLVGLTGLAGYISVLFLGDRFLSISIPFALLYGARAILRKPLYGKTAKVA